MSYTICRSELNKIDEKCDYCTIMFCTYCIEPAKQNCVIYQHRYGSFHVPITPHKTMVEPVIEPEPIKEAITEPVVKAEPTNKPVVQVTQVNTVEEVQTANKISLWRKILSIFGFSG